MGNPIQGLGSNSTGQNMVDSDWLDVHFEASRPEYEGMLLAVGFQSGWSVVDAAGRKPFLDTDALAMQSWNRRQPAWNEDGGFTCTGWFSNDLQNRQGEPPEAVCRQRVARLQSWNVSQMPRAYAQSEVDPKVKSADR